MLYYTSITTQAIGCTQFYPAFALSTLTLTGAASPVAYPAFGFTAPETGTLQSAAFFLTGTGITNVKVSLYNDDGTGRPVTTGPIAGSEGPAASVASSTMNTFNFGASSEGVSVVAGTRYHAVLKSYTAGQNPNVSFMPIGPPAASSSQFVGFTSVSSATSADNWGTMNAGRLSGVYTMASGNKFGAMYNYSYNTAPTNANIEMGAKFISPPIWFATNALSISLFKGGAPTGDVYVNLYVNDVKCAVSAPIRAESLTTTTGSVTVNIPAVVIPPSSICRITWSSNAGDTGANYIRANRLVKLAGGSPDFPLSAVQTVSVNGGSWTDTTSQCPWFVIIGSAIEGPEILPFPINRRRFNSMR